MKRELFSDVYRKLSHLYSASCVREDEVFRVPEKTIRCVWNDQLFKTSRLRTTGGEPLEILFPGFWNFGAGPDFSKAVIRVNKKTYEGDVELHVYGTDWKAHRHSANPDYDRVVLHVFMWKDRKQRPGAGPPAHRSTGARDGAHFFELELKDVLAHGVLDLTHRLDFDNYPVFNTFNCGRCHEPMGRLPEKQLTALLQSAGDARILAKMHRLDDGIILNGYEQTAYEGTATALGYPANKRPFQILAERLPLATLKGLVPANANVEERTLHLEAMLLGGSGLLEPALRKANDAHFRQLAELWRHHGNRVSARPLPPGVWTFAGLRPANSPSRRIAGLAHLLARHWTGGLFADFMQPLKNAVGKNDGESYALPKTVAQTAHQFFCLETDGYWADHYIPGGKRLRRPDRLIGAERSAAIAVNVFLPIGLIYARAGKSPALETVLSAIYRAVRPAPDNKSVRFMKQYILGNRKDLTSLVTSEREQQGLIQIYQDYCTQNGNNCQRCPFPDVVEKFFS
jgi:hypothetical protein